MRCVRIGLLGLAAALAACTSSGSVAPRSTPGTASAPAPTASFPPPGTPHLAGPWPTYHGDNARSGFLRAPALSLPLHRAWVRELDGAVYAQPLAVGTFVIAATENNSVYALRSDTGAVVWRRHLAAPIPRSQLPCGNIDPLGITGTPAYDVDTDDLFVVTETSGGRHDLQAIDVRDGRVQWTRNLDVVNRDPLAQQQRSAVLVTHDKVYVAFGGLYGDCGNYVGYVAAVATDGNGSIGHYAVPAGREAGIWAPPGPVEDANGDLLVAVGNGSGTGGRYDGSDSVLRLSPGLRRLGFFAPSTWAADNAADLDLGSSSPILVGHHVVIAGKRGTAYLLAPGLGGIGHELATLEGCAAYGGGAATGTTAVLPCNDGLRRLDVTDGGMHWTWHVPGVAGSPLIVGGTVYALSADSGDLYAIDLGAGHVRARVHVGDVTRFATPAPIGQGLAVGTTTGIAAYR